MTIMNSKVGVSIACAMLVAACAAHGGEHGHDWRAEPHHTSLLVASTVEEHETAPSLGLDYEYRMSEFLGVGTVVEHAFGEIDATNIFAVADLHFTNKLIIQTGPGVEFKNGREEPVFRVGALYELEREGFTLSPQLYYDWTSGSDAIVLGLAVGVGF